MLYYFINNAYIDNFPLVMRSALFLVTRSALFT